MKYGKKVTEILKDEKLYPSKSRVTLTPGKALKLYRDLQGLTQGELAELSGLKQMTISSLEHDRISLGLERAKALARALKVHPSALAFPDWNAEEEFAA